MQKHQEYHYRHLTTTTNTVFVRFKSGCPSIVIILTISCREIGETGDCGKFAAGIAYMIAYLTLRWDFDV